MSEKGKETYSTRAKKWVRKNGLHGSQAYLRYVFFTFLDCLCKGGDEFVFKGGNLLWLYIKTPRQTVDLDLATRKVNEVEKVRRLLEEAGARGDGIEFKVKSLKEVTNGELKGAAVTMGFRTEDGAANTFDLDIVFALPTDSELLPSPLSTKGEIRAATLENILVDKISASHRFRSGNTRMKDFDDLWRLSKCNAKIEMEEVRKRLGEKSMPMKLEAGWIDAAMENAWKRHIVRYKDLPTDLATIFADVNRWLSGQKEK